MKNTYFRHAAIVIIGIMVSVFAQKLLASTGMDHLDRFFQELKTLRADFSQVVLDENLTPIEESSGRLWISRPNRFPMELSRAISSSDHC